MARNILADIRSALSTLNPSEVREAAERPVRIALVADDAEDFEAMEDWLAPPSLSNEKRFEALESVFRLDEETQDDRYDFALVPAGAGLEGDKRFEFYLDNPRWTACSVLERRPDLHLALGRVFQPFRREVTFDIIQTVARENAMFSLATALPNILPGWASAVWSVGEFASDTTVLTANQIRMAFLLAAASDRTVGFKEQRTEIGSLMAGAFGWRAVARELAGKIPFGGGLIPKAAIAFAGTFVVGVSLERLYRVGEGLTREERKSAYEEAYERGKQIAGAMVEAYKRGRGAR
ncbi:MAG: hypothetical protein SFV54_03195 [Bryobacteraceae bacterium]|nr:hypothetical protein [Bryobacteraceae bacterium]